MNLADIEIKTAAHWKRSYINSLHAKINVIQFFQNRRSEISSFKLKVAVLSD